MVWVWAASATIPQHIYFIPAPLPAATAILNRKRGAREVLGSPSSTLGDTPVARRTRAGKKKQKAAAAPACLAAVTTSSTIAAAAEDEEPAPAPKRRMIRITIRNMPTREEGRAAVVAQRAANMVQEFMTSIDAMCDSGGEHGGGEGGTGGKHQGHSSVRQEGAASRAPAVVAGASEEQIQEENLLINQDGSYYRIEPTSKDPLSIGPSLQDATNNLTNTGLQQAARLASALNDKITRLIARRHTAKAAAQPSSAATSSSNRSCHSPSPSPPVLEREGPIPRPANWSIYDRSAYNLQDRGKEARVQKEIWRRKRLESEKQQRRRAAEERWGDF